MGTRRGARRSRRHDGGRLRAAQRTLEPAAGREPVVAVPLGLLRRLALDVRALAISDSWRYGDEEEAGNEWEAILDQAERTLATEAGAT